VVGISWLPLQSALVDAVTMKRILTLAWANVHLISSGFFVALTMCSWMVTDGSWAFVHSTDYGKACADNYCNVHAERLLYGNV
jgi:hypothetical protein